MDWELLSRDQRRTVLGERLRALRLARNLTQHDVAQHAGLSRFTVANVEKGDETTLDSFLAVLDALGLLDRLEELVPEPSASPIEALSRRSGKPRQRSSGTRREATRDSGGWRWGDET